MDEDSGCSDIGKVTVKEPGLVGLLGSIGEHRGILIVGSQSYSRKVIHDGSWGHAIVELEFALWREQWESVESERKLVGG